MYGRAYIQGGAVVALHVSNQPINLIVMDGCTLYDLTLEQDVTYSELTYAAGTITGPGVTACKAV